MDMTKQDIVNRINVVRQVNAELLAEHVNTAREFSGDHNVYTELVEWHKGKLAALDIVLEMLEA